MNTKLEHTLGPWETRTNRLLKAQVISKRYSREPIAVTMGDHDKATHEANARLIALAPEMLAVLELISDEVDSSDGIKWRTVQMARKAITAARGNGGAA